MTFRPSPSIITEPVARNTIIVFYICLAISTCTTLVLVPKTWNVICQQKRKRVKHSLSTVFSGLSATKKVGEFRLVYLTIASLLLVAESINSLVYYHTLWETGTANSFALNLVRVVTVYTAAPTVAVATLYRTAIIIVMQQRLRILCIRAFLGITSVIMMVVYVTVVQSIVRYAELDISGWQSVAILPQWTAALLAMFPVMLITLSLWSLKIAFGTIKAPGSSEAAIVSLAPTSLSNPNPAAGNHVENQSGTSAHGRNEPASNPQMALGLTFKVLTVCILIYWIMFLVIIALFRPFPIHSTAITCTLVALAVATEASFEWLVVQSAKVGTHSASSMLPSGARSKMGTMRSTASVTVSKSVMTA